MVLVDTNVLVDVLQDDPQWADGSIGQMRAQASIHPLAINAVIHAELSLSFSTLEALDGVVATLTLERVVSIRSGRRHRSGSTALRGACTGRPHGFSTACAVMQPQANHVTAKPALIRPTFGDIHRGSLGAGGDDGTCRHDDLP